MSAHVLLNLLNELGKSDKMRGLGYGITSFRASLTLQETRSTRAVQI